jgi:hypothetical protein
MTKPTYTAEDLTKLIELSETKEDLFYIDDVFRVEEKLYQQEESSSIKEALVKRLIKVCNMKAYVIQLNEGSFVKCENCGKTNFSFQEKCKECNCQL